MSKKALLIGGIIVAAGALVGIVVWRMNALPVQEQPPKSIAPQQEPIQPTKPSEPSQQTTSSPKIVTSGWKTYRNNEYGIELKYPSSLVFIPNGVARGGNVAGEVLSVVFSSPQEEFDIYLRVYPETKYKTIKEYKTSLTTEAENLSLLTVANREWLEGGDAGPIGTVTYQTINGSYRYELAFEGTGPKSAEYTSSREKLMKGILATISFGKSK